MKPVAAFLLALSILSACKQEDTTKDAMWRRTIEPRLTSTREWSRCVTTLRSDHVVAEARCAAPVLAAERRCDDSNPVGSREQALRLLVTKPGCIDKAVNALARYAPFDPAAKSDLAAAYYLRAQRQDNATDLLRALEAAEHAPATPANRFNLALILEALNLDEDALQVWTAVAQANDGEWSREARAHSETLRRNVAHDGLEEWYATVKRLEDAVRRGDITGTERAIRVFPASAQTWFENEVLTAWARSPNPANLRSVSVAGNALAAVTHDRYGADVANSFGNARGQTVQLLREAQLAFYQSRKGPQAGWVEQARLAAALFERAASPMALTARLQAVTKEMLGDDASALTDADAIVASGGASRYPTLAARVQLNRVTALQYVSRLTESVAAADAAIAGFNRADDWESLLSARTRRAGVTIVLGLKDVSFRDALISDRGARAAVNLNTRHIAPGTAALAANDLGFADAALRYQRKTVSMLRHLITKWPQGRKTFELHLAIALRALAGLEAETNDFAAARRDLDEAFALSRDPGPSIAKALEARLFEVQGDLLVRRHSPNAVDALTKAIDRANGGEYLSYSAMLYVERAAAYRNAGNTALAEADLRAAIDRLRDEEQRQLKARGDVDPVWDPYFSRFSAVYERLIRQLVEEGRADEAFQYAERERAFEPVDLILRRPNAPPQFRALAGNANVDVQNLQAMLPAGTFIVEYRVLNDRTYVWVVSRDGVKPLTLDILRTDVDHWTSALQDAARAHDVAAFDAALFAPYEKLIDPPLKVIRATSGDAPRRIVFVPDGALHGLPFAALRDRITRRYLIEEQPVSIAGSALLYVFSLTRDASLRSAEVPALLIGDPTFDRTATLTQNLDELPAARHEVATIGELYPGSRTLIGSDATAASFLELAAHSGIVHIAAHAIANASEPLQSYIVFAKSGSDDGLLTAQALIKQLDASQTRLMILAACSSTGGAPIGAEGVAPLVRPIVTAGVPGIIGSLSDVGDATAAEVLVSFHRHYSKGLDAAAALQAAQLEMLRSHKAGLRPALAWAPFQAIGFASSPFARAEVKPKEKPP